MRELGSPEIKRVKSLGNQAMVGGSGRKSFKKSYVKKPRNQDMLSRRQSHGACQVARKETFEGEKKGPFTQRGGRYPHRLDQFLNTAQSFRTRPEVLWMLILGGYYRCWVI